jgi:hypothetical protein
MTIGVLAPYRSCGVGTEMLEQTLKDAEKDASLSEAYLHVQVKSFILHTRICEMGHVPRQDYIQFQVNSEPANSQLNIIGCILCTVCSAVHTIR